MSPHRCLWATLAATTLAFVACAPATAAAAEKNEQKPEIVQAIWKEQEIGFYYQSFTTFYSCDALENKVERIMRALGGKDVKARVRSADCSGRVARMPRVELDMVSPVLATPEAIAERDKGKSTRELAARLKGERADGTEATDEFAATWRRVSLSRGDLGLEPGDCELIEEIERKVLPKLAVRVIEDQVRCTPHQVTLGQPSLVVEALVEAPKPDDKPIKKEADSG